ncbi:hypothetical protein AX15_004026 [Amanita polypyramis BW_CC]|nr:hypothetical protein AX15_004026 [Amanita polypyramis BW_CC]
MTVVHPDLTTVEGIRGYLKGTRFASSGVIVGLDGGTCNFTYRVELEEPYSGKKTGVVKHARSYVKEMPAVLFDLSRQSFEVEALKRVKSIMPDDALVTVPEVYLFDEKANVIIMEDRGETSVPLKQFMRAGRLSPSMGVKLGKELGIFIGRLHLWGKDRAVWEYFDGHKEARQMSAWAYYGRLYETLDPNQNADLAVLRDPPLEVSPEDLQVVKKVADKMSHAIQNEPETFVMGDFWPGNIMIRVGEGEEVERAYIIDWEMSKPGLAGVEIGQFCAEIGFVRHFHPEYAAAANAVLSTFLEAYKETAMPGEGVLDTAAVHMGTHYAVIGTRVEWGGREATRAVATEGVRLIVGGGDIRVPTA